MSDEPVTEKKPKPEGPAQGINWTDFRDHLATADKEGRRQWIFPR
jgi:hypothetical protein